MNENNDISNRIKPIRSTIATIRILIKIAAIKACSETTEPHQSAIIVARNPTLGKENAKKPAVLGSVKSRYVNGNAAFYKLIINCGSTLRRVNSSPRVKEEA